MDVIKSAILIGCVMGIITSLADLSVPEGSLKKQLNVVIGLIMILSIISPFLGSGFKIALKDYNDNFKDTKIDMDKFSDSVLYDITNRKTEEYFTGKLKENGIEIKKIIISSRRNEYNEIEIYKTEIELENQEDESKAKEIISEELKDTEIVFMEAENAESKIGRES